MTDEMDNLNPDVIRAEYQARAQEAAYRLAVKIAPAFMSAVGSTALDALREQTTAVSVLGQNAINIPVTTISPEHWAFLREGQNSVIRFIEGCVAIAQQGPPKEETDNG
ncbi:MAG: hypothetical protein AB7Q04_12960 [Steroidobacteraceae bacterium]